MKILLVSMQFGPGYTQGTERYLASLGDWLGGRGHDVKYLTGDPLRLYGARRLGDTIDPPRRIHAYPTSGWTAVRGLAPRVLAGWLRRHRPDLIHVANPAHIGCGIALAARQLRIPLVVTTMDCWWVCPKATLLRPDGTICDGRPGWRECIRCAMRDHPRPLLRLAGRLPASASGLTAGALAAAALARGRSPREVWHWRRRREMLLGCLDAVDAVIFPSRALSELIVPRLTHARGTVIPYGLPQEWFTEPRPARGSTLPPEDLVLGFAGAMLAHKAPHLLLEAMRRLGWTRTRVRMAGPLPPGAYTRRLRQLAEGLNVEFLGQVPAGRMPAFLRSLHALVLTSIWPENLPFIVLEAHAAGVPVLASDLPGVREQVSDPRLRFVPGSVESLAQVLEHLRAHPAEARPEPVNTIDEMGEQTEAIYSLVVQDPARPDGPSSMRPR